jgi:hypothetical protein
LTYAYLKALGRRNGEEVAVNTSFNVAGPIAQTRCRRSLHAQDDLVCIITLEILLKIEESRPDVPGANDVYFASERRSGKANAEKHTGSADHAAIQAHHVSSFIQGRGCEAAGRGWSTVLRLTTERQIHTDPNYSFGSEPMRNR